MRAVLKFLPLMLLFAFLIACNNTTSDPEEKSDKIADTLNATLKIDPMEAKVNEEVTFTVELILNGKNVTEVDELVLEIWREEDTNKEHQMIEISLDNKQQDAFVYVTTFNEIGTYQVNAHVAVNGLHEMPKETFKIVE